MNLREPKVQRLIVVVLLVAAIGYVYFGTQLFSFCYPARRAKIKNLEAQYTKLSAELEKARKMVGNLARLEAEYVRLHDQWLAAQELLPVEEEMPELLRKVTTAGNKAGVKFMLFQPLPPQPSEYYTSHPIKVRVRGGYHHVGIFLSRLANLGRIVNVSSLTLKATTRKKNEDMGKGTVMADFTLTAYTLAGGVDDETKNQK